MNKPEYQEVSLSKNIRSVAIGEERFLEVMMQALEENWQHSDFTIEECCTLLNHSKSQLYRKCISIFKTSPNTLIREYRLIRSLHLLDAGNNVSETTFEIGFSSPSYFTKCFQKRYGLAPLHYLKM